MQSSSINGKIYALVLIDRPARALDRPFTYAVPEGLRSRLRVGHYVLVPFGQQTLPGFVIGFTDIAGDFHIKPIYGLLLDEPLFNERLLALARWIAEYYVSSLAEAVRLLLPPGGSRKVRKLVSLTALGRTQEALALVQRAPRQKEIVAFLQQRLDAASGATETEIETEKLISALCEIDQKTSVNAIENALGALQERGLVSIRRELQRPAVQPLERQVVSLVEKDINWEELLERLQERAPRQAEIIATLLLSQDGTAALAEFSYAAARALEQKGYVTIHTEIQERAPEVVAWQDASSQFLPLNAAQQRVYEAVSGAIKARQNQEVLLHGVTGSGKTEVYLHCVDLALRQGRTAIVLVPEIALTPQIVGRFRARLGEQLALLHSALSTGERFDEWQRLRRQEARIVIGARSALFAPLQDVGIIIVDEVHERAYKQEQPPRYHSIEVARQRARLEQAVLLLGSATPPVELYWEATVGSTWAAHEAPSAKKAAAIHLPADISPTKSTAGASASEAVIAPPQTPLQLWELPHRIDHRPLPEMAIIDLRGETLVGTGQTFSQRLLDAIADRLQRGEQIMLFLNRRGFSTFIMCRECGYVLRCPDCDISLTFHYQGHACTCHHCDYARHMPQVCPECQSQDIGFYGLGTEKVADQLGRHFPQARVARMDRDTVAHKGAYGRILSAFAAGQSDILVGTQMIAKGHDFPGVTLVGVLNADTGLHRPDFRAGEHTFQLLTQVAGRAGRADKPGEVLVQTYNPDHYAILTASRHDYQGFYQRELAARKKNAYPPFVQLARLVLAAEDEKICQQEAMRLRETLLDMGIAEKQGSICFLGPARPPLKKLRGRFRWSLLLKSQEACLSAFVRELLQRSPLSRSVAVTVDIDPMDMM